MEVAEIWLLLGLEVYLDFIVDNPDLLVGFRAIFDSFSLVQCHQLHEYLGDALRRPLSNYELTQLWASSGANLLVEEDDIRRFLEVLRGELAMAIDSRH